MAQPSRRHHHARRPPVSHDWAAIPLGVLSARFESGRSGPETVSSGLTTGGAPDPGGVSYGTWQLASRRHRPQEFLAREGRVWAPRFARPDEPPGRTELLPVGGHAFSAVWRQLGHDAPGPFEAAQYRYMVRTHYDVQIAAIRKHAGLDLSSHSVALGNVIFSTATQHGPHTHVVIAAMGKLKAKADAPEYDALLIVAIYDERSRRHPATKPRYEQERDAALEMLEQERTPPSTIQAPTVPLRHP